MLGVGVTLCPRPVSLRVADRTYAGLVVTGSATPSLETPALRLPRPLFPTHLLSISVDVVTPGTRCEQDPVGLSL